MNEQALAKTTEHGMLIPSDGEQAVCLNRAIDDKYAELALYKGYLLTIIKEEQYWKGRADSFGEFLNDKTLNRVAQSQAEKYMRLYSHYIKGLHISPQELSGIPLDSLDRCKKIITTREEFEDKKEFLQQRTKEINETLRDLTGATDLNEMKISKWVAHWVSFTDDERQLSLKKSGLNQFRFQKKCAECGKFSLLDEHHEVKRSQGGKAYTIDEAGNQESNIKYLCDSCHDKVERALL